MKASNTLHILSLIALVCTALGSLCCSNASGAEHAVQSPDGKVTVRLVCEDSRLSYSLVWNERELFKNSALSLVPNAEYSVMGTEISSIDTSWETVWGQFSSVQDRCEQMVLKVDVSGIQAELMCRVYNDGVGFRFVVPQQQILSNTAVNFVCEYNAAESFKGWFPNGENEPIGPVPFGTRGSRKMPAVIDASRGVFLGLLESDLYTAKGFKTAVLSGSQSESKATLTCKGMTTPWRVILLGTQPGTLLTSTVPLNLAAECKIEDTSWIKTGKSLWDWRVHGYQAGDFTYGINTASYMRFIDFAAENKIRYFLIDDSWFKKVENGKLVIKPEVDLKQIMDYAKGMAVDIILYYDRHKGKSLGDNELFKLYSEFGASGIKYGFMGNNAQFTRRAVEETAANKLLVNFHDNPCPMTGISRTLPNAITREFCHCQQDCRKAFTPTAFLKMSMINALSGPLDQNNGAYGLDGINNGEREKGPLIKNSYNSTVVSETARTLVISSGLIILPDAPEEYAKKADLFEFIRHMPATWDESRVIHSKIGEHISTARRSRDQWFVGSVINEQGGMLRIPLDFLEKGKRYDVTFYEDAPDTHYIKNRESYRIRKGTVTGKDTIEARMAPGGGHCMWIRPVSSTEKKR
jgi:alpha-glucosidase